MKPPMNRLLTVGSAPTGSLKRGLSCTAADSMLLRKLGPLLTICLGSIRDLAKSKDAYWLEAEVDVR